MNLKVYEKTRYQNIYRHRKNKNYVVMMSKPVKSSIAIIDGEKIFKIDDAIKIRDNPKIKIQKGLEVTNKEDFDSLWEKYIYSCKYIMKLAYTTILEKEKMYNKYAKNAFSKKVSKISKEDVTLFIENMNTTYKQKNAMLKELKAFFNWCIKEEYLITSPAKNISKYKVEKTEMKYWTPNEITKFIYTLNQDIDNKVNIYTAYRTKIFTLLEFSLGDRVGETRALTFDSIDNKLGVIKIKHSINYDRKSDDFLSHTKNYHSQREVDISYKIIQEVENYKQFLIENTEYEIKDSNLIFFNYVTKKPYSDVALRKSFYYYCDKAQVTKIRMYDLRHTYVATMMGEGKELYHISSRIGHNNYSTTVNKYGHLSIKKRKEIAELTDKYI